MSTESIPGVTWKPSTDGVANADLMISRTTRGRHDPRERSPSSIPMTMIRANTRISILSRTRIPRFLPVVDWNINKNHRLTLRYNDVVGTSDQTTNSNSGPPNNATQLRPYQQPVDGLLKCFLRLQEYRTFNDR
ncbi:MAG: hypothetical protein MZV63_50520 [Marinilabiliales bacterium]|nr:hypothetical protein [Marinilabiliales bacterium]